MRHSRKLEFERGSSQSQESHNERLLPTTLGERALANNRLEYLYTAKKLSYEWFFECQNCKNFFSLTDL